MRKEIPTTMGIAIIIVYIFILAVPLYFLWRGIKRDTVIFTTIDYKKTKKEIENRIDDERYLDFVNTEEDDLSNNIE